ncbi:MAG: AAA family ATPase [Bacteroidota bacterium]|nr:AAA family ATPase [Bacteroidota bacterium]
MQIIKYSCHLTKEVGYKDEWIIDDIYLNNLNLLVGKNSTGKSRALRVIKLFSQAILHSQLINAHFIFYFRSESYGELCYQIKCGTGLRIYEKITTNNSIVLLERYGNEAKIYSFLENRIQTIHPPDKKLTLHSRRDVNEYPFFEEIVTWAESLQYFNFGHLHASLNFDNQSQERDKTISSQLSIGEMVNLLSTDGKNEIITMFNSLGYELEDVVPNLNKEKKEIIIREKYLTQGLIESSISQGMYRALSLLIFIKYNQEQNKLKTLVIDDLCEGLDYERSSMLGKTIFAYLATLDTQLVATTNDYFLMNSVDTAYWNVLRRKQNIVKSYNIVSNASLFKKFDFSGLMNFDFFSSDFIDSESSEI